jgi:hypothetical protein
MLFAELRPPFPLRRGDSRFRGCAHLAPRPRHACQRRYRTPLQSRFEFRNLLAYLAAFRLVAD